MRLGLVGLGREAEFYSAFGEEGVVLAGEAEGNAHEDRAFWAAQHSME